MRTIIIEDEAVAATEIRTLIEESFPDIAIECVLQTVEESVEWFNSHELPDLVFMDIHLADGSSFSIFEEAEIRCPIIFTTAYDEYALKAFEVNSIDYLLKPISREALKRAVGKYRDLKGIPSSHESDAVSRLIATLGETRKNFRSSFLIHDRDKLIPLPVKDIAYIYIDAKVVTAVTYDQRHRVLDQTLDELSSQLDPLKFFRANRQYIIARAAVKDMSAWFGGKLAINLIIPTPEKIHVSKTRVREFKQWITG